MLFYISCFVGTFFFTIRPDRSFVLNRIMVVQVGFDVLKCQITFRSEQILTEDAQFYYHCDIRC